ncbi:UNVERIFIED_ORG: hypothetical protein J2Y78_004927 [Buttiauxella agrestis ATCC 33320]
MIEFTENEIENWLDFSGDNNPIHQKNKLIKTSGENIVVPGMLSGALLKEDFINHYNFSRLNLLFQKNIKTNESLCQHNEKNNIYLISCDDNECSIHGKMDNSLSQYSYEHDLGTTVLDYSEFRLKTSLPKMFSSPLLFTEAMMFRDLLHLCKSALILGINGEELLETGRLVHMSNTLTINHKNQALEDNISVENSLSVRPSSFNGWDGFIFCQARSRRGNITSSHMFGVLNGKIRAGSC